MHNPESLQIVLSTRHVENILLHNCLVSTVDTVNISEFVLGLSMAIKHNTIELHPNAL